MTDIPETIYSRAREALAYAQTALSSGEPERAVEIIAREIMRPAPTAGEASDVLFEALQCAFRRGANWVAINGGADGVNKAAYDYADYETSPVTAAERAAAPPAVLEAS